MKHKISKQFILQKFNAYFLFGLLIIGLGILSATENQTTRVDANGSFIAVWQEDTSLGTEIKSSALPSGFPSWEVPTILSITPVASKPKLAILANGLDTMAVAIWVEVVGGTAHLYGAMRPSLGGGWTPAVLISNGIEDVYGHYDLNMSSSGFVVASWDSLQGGTTALRSSSAALSLPNVWSAPVSISP
jgi:hypothetical protein